MLKTRVISSLVGLVMLGIVVWSGYIVLGVSIFILSLIGITEFYNAVENIGYKPIRIIGYVSCVPVLFISFNGAIRKIQTYVELFESVNYFSFAMFVVVLSLFIVIIFCHDKYNIGDISITVFGTLYVAFLFLFIMLTRNLDNGLSYIWLIFIGAWATDTFAYFSGVLLGRTKILPVISPKKTLEGSVGGILGCVTITLVYGIIQNKYGMMSNISILHLVILGILCGVISQIGDFAASAVKRYVKVKDYGSIMPGHGGVLDRFDSILFIGPVVYFYISFLIIK